MYAPITVNEGSSAVSRSQSSDDSPLHQTGKTALPPHQPQNVPIQHKRHRDPTDYVTTHKVGTIGELIVAADLVARGYEVFKNVAIHGKVDLIAYKDGRCQTIQVRCKHEPCPPIKLRSPVDVLAIVLPSHRVIYTPEMAVRYFCRADWCGHEHTPKSAADWSKYTAA